MNSYEDDNDDDDENGDGDDDDEDVQIGEGLDAGHFEMLDDSVVEENQAIEMEQLMYEYKPHDVETIGLENEYELQEEDEDVPNDENILLEDDISEKYFTPEMDGHSGLGEKPYERVVPVKYADGGDSFMSSMIQNYALEGKNEDGTPNGKFYMNEPITRHAATEVLKTHKKLEGKELEDYMKQYFDRTFAHFDVTKDGILDVDVMPQFMRFLASDQSMQLE
jgi:hypothetical protein